MHNQFGRQVSLAVTKFNRYKTKQQQQQQQQLQKTNALSMWSISSFKESVSKKIPQMSNSRTIQVQCQCGHCRSSKNLTITKLNRYQTEQQQQQKIVAN